MAKAARDTGLQHVIWSTLEDTRKWVPLEDSRMPTLMGKYKVPHFDAKGEADGIFLELGLPATLLLTSFYWDNVIHFGMGPKRGPDGTLALTLPMGDKKLPGIGAEDLGNMFQFKHDFESDFCGARDPVFSRSLNPELLTFETWLSQNRNRIPLEQVGARARTPDRKSSCTTSTQARRV